MIKIFYIFFFSFFSIFLYSNSYITYPKTESGKELLELYQSSFFPSYFTYSKKSFIKIYAKGNLNKKFSYGSLFIYSEYPYGIFSLSFVENDVNQLFLLPQQNFIYKHKENSFNFTYQNGFKGYLFQIGLNVSDPIHLKAFRFGGQILVSMNFGFQVHLEPYFLFEIGFCNLFKKSSIKVHDQSEQFFTSVVFRLLKKLSFKISFHRFKNDRFQAYILSRYYFIPEFYSGINLSLKPFSYGISNKLSMKWGSINLSLGGRKNSDFFISLAFSIAFIRSKNYFLQNLKSIFNSNFIVTDKNKSNFLLININLANEKELSSLPGIGTKIARRIINYRQGELFYEIKNIMNVNGIGLNKFKKIQNFITVGKIDLLKKMCRLKNWNMKNFVDLGLNPSLALDLVIFIQYDENYYKFEDLILKKKINLQTFTKIKNKLKEYDCK